MSISTTATPVVREWQAPASAPCLSPTEQTDSFAALVDSLQQRDLLAPCLLLSAGYVGAPFFLRQVLLLLSPLFALWGLAPQPKEPPLGSR